MIIIIVVVFYNYYYYQHYYENICSFFATQEEIHVYVFKHRLFALFFLPLSFPFVFVCFS